MKKSRKPEPILQTETEPIDYTPTQSQIDMLARRLMPEIKKFFADENIQKEFAEWQSRNHSMKDNQ